MSRKASNQSKFIRCLKAPIRILCLARDFYVRSMTNCAGSNFMGCPTGPIYSLPKSLSVGSSASNHDEDFRELVRAASTKSLGSKIETDLVRLRKQQPSVMMGSKGVPRSFTVTIGRIDEEKPCDFGEDSIKVKTDSMYPRSRSYAVPRKSAGVFS